MSDKSNSAAEVLDNLTDPGREGTQEAQAAHAHATTAKEDPPTEISGSHGSEAGAKPHIGQGGDVASHA
jgi:hypothetical protein